MYMKVYIQQIYSEDDRDSQKEGKKEKLTIELVDCLMTNLYETSYINYVCVCKITLP